MLKVLIVEDEELIRKGIVLTVDWAALDCLVVGEAANGAEGLEQAARCNPDLIITDLKMPQMDGIEMLEKLRGMGKNTYVIILTAYDSFSYIQAALRLEAVDYLLKPFHDGDLEKAVQRVQAKLAPKEQALPEPKTGSTNRYVAMAISYIQQHYQEPDISVSSVAQSLNISEGHLSHTFKKETGSTLLGYLTRYRVHKAAELLKDIFPCYVPVESVLMTGFGGGGGMLHSIPCTLNINKIEMKQQFEYYIEGLTPAVCRVIEKADAERVAVCRALGIEAEPLLQHLKNVYGLKPDDLYEAIQSCEPYRGIKSPMDTNHRFMQEDTLSDLVPTASFGHMLGVPVPTIDMIIELESIMLGKDFKAEGRTVEKLGLEGRTPEEIRELVK